MIKKSMSMQLLYWPEEVKITSEAFTLQTSWDLGSTLLDGYFLLLLQADQCLVVENDSEKLCGILSMCLPLQPHHILTIGVVYVNANCSNSAKEIDNKSGQFVQLHSSSWWCSSMAAVQTIKKRKRRQCTNAFLDTL